MERIKTVSRDMTMKEILAKFPGSSQVMMKFGLHCLGCPVSDMETLEDGARLQGMDEEELRMMLDELNRKAIRIPKGQRTLFEKTW